VKKYNTGACVQCHTTAPDFRDVARADYDGSGGAPQLVQDEIAGLLSKLSNEINNKLAALLGNANNSWTVASGRIVYTLTANLATGPYTTFPGPSVPTSQNPTSWNSLSAQQKADWLALYQAAYNYTFVKNDQSNGIHNTGYAVNLLQSSIKAINPVANAGSPFVPF